jgi:hypothetical protein
MADLCPVQGEQGNWHPLSKRFPKKQTAAIGWMAAVLEIFETSVPQSLNWGFRFPSPWENSTDERKHRRPRNGNRKQRPAEPKLPAR